MVGVAADAAVVLVVVAADAAVDVVLCLRVLLLVLALVVEVHLVIQLVGFFACCIVSGGLVAVGEGGGSGAVVPVFVEH